ncbi:MAG: hypothetical protein IJJ26_10420 [Victivallales bacterium]|nr:hypothetical protein [Victivallales bacterium]
MSFIRFIDQDNSTQEVPLVSQGNVFRLPKGQIPTRTQDIEFHFEDFTAPANTDGYFLIPSVPARNRPTGLCHFRPHADQEIVYRHNDLPVFGVKNGSRAFLAVVSGMSLTYSIVFGVKDGLFYVFPRFHCEDGETYEDPEVTLLPLNGNDATWSGMARAYRDYQLGRGACTSLRDRARKYPVVGKTTDAIPIRIRHAWKPVPTPVLDQIPGVNEPPLTVAVTFQRACELLDRLHEAGVAHADICLVGWNIGGHDGRFPDIFPPDPRVGTWEDLKELIAKAKSYGYLIAVHTCPHDSYSISKRLDKDDYLIDADGRPHYYSKFSGGQCILLCPKQAHLHYATEDVEQLAALGFRGTHYFDVLSINPPLACHHRLHPLNEREAGEWRARTLQYGREMIGASASEGGLDFCIGALDYVLYTYWTLFPNLEGNLVDEIVPFWFIAYHGIVTYNSSCETMNSMAKDPNAFLLNTLYGGRPAAYFYAKYRTNSFNWMGEEDLTCTTDEALDDAVKRIANAYQKFALTADLQYEYLDDIFDAAPSLRVAKYANGTRIVCNFDDKPASFEGKTIPPHDFLRL